MNTKDRIKRLEKAVAHLAKAILDTENGFAWGGWAEDLEALIKEMGDQEDDEEA